MPKDRKVVILQIGDRLWAFGSVKALTDNFGEKAIGVSYPTLVRHLWTMRKKQPEGSVTWRNHFCVITETNIVTCPKSEKTAESRTT